MKPFYPNLSRWILPLCLIPCCLDGTAQTHPSPGQLSWHTAFITHAPVLLPTFLEDKQYDSIRNFLGNWQNSEYPSLELIFGAEALLAIETGTFSSYLLPCDCLFFLADYARERRDFDTQGSKFRYYLKLAYPYTYDATIEARSLILFLQNWAQDLLRRRGPALNNDERFICHTLAGDISDPLAVAQATPGSCPRVAGTQRLMRSYDNAIVDSRRHRDRGTAGVLVGSWIPTGNLGRVLGTHPSVGIQLGGQGPRNEFDVTWTFRFLHPTPQAYTIIRHDTAYADRYYDGGYIGFEYTRYIVHEKLLDFGWTMGMGYDYFSVAYGWTAHPDDNYLDPFLVGSWNWNYGLRVKKFFMNSSYLGITVKYNMIYYRNTGGTDLGGNAFTIDFSYGVN